MNYAGFWVRLMAYNVDFMFYLLMAMLLRWAIDTPETMYPILAGGVYAFEVGFLLSDWSATPGRRLMKIKVTDLENEKLPPWKVLLRTFMKLPSLLILFIGFGMIAFRKDHKALHDLVAGSQVIMVKDPEF